MATMHPAERLAAAIDKFGSPVCVGLDPVLENLPADLRARHHEPTAAIAEFCRGVLRACAGVAPAVKFQSACFERYGSRGFAVMEDAVAEAVRLGLVVVWDAKRGDISTTAAHYAAAATHLGAHWITASPYLGASGLTPLLDAGLGVFSLVRTSNPDSDAVQRQPLIDGRTVGEMIASFVQGVGFKYKSARELSALGAVVGATKSAEAAAMRQRMPDQLFLIPGYGAQGGTAEDIRAMVRPGKSIAECGVLVTASRSVIYAQGSASWEQNIHDAAARFATEVAGVVRA
ncbi:MAG TPA: orotidine-5'-phosphate decarboxylase [Phycisphaerales bacterium]|nr:orotidine-5'-phosphate decarboxylase [Phycisphaerales bacterium]